MQMPQRSAICPPSGWPVLLLLALLIGTPATASTTLPGVDSLLILTREARDNELNNALTTLLQAPPAQIEIAESHLLHYARRLRELPASDSGRHALQRLMAYQSQILDPPHDPRSPSRPPRYPLAAAARGTLQLWEAASRGKRLQEATIEPLPQEPQALAKRLITVPPGNALKLLPRILELPPEDALQTLELLTTETHLASAAVLLVGQLASSYPVAREYLLDWLTDPVLGSSAVEALARLDEPELLTIVQQHYRQVPELRSQLLFLLTRSQLPGALTLLQELADDPQTPPALRNKLQPWRHRP